jgi:hypothetical protein
LAAKLRPLTSTPISRKQLLRLERRSPDVFDEETLAIRKYKYGRGGRVDAMYY